MSDILQEFRPTPAALAKTLMQRAVRESQRKCRGGKRSYRDEVENLAVLLALEAGDITEGQAATAITNGDRVLLREMSLRAQAFGGSLARALKPSPSPGTIYAKP